MAHGLLLSHLRLTFEERRGHEDGDVAIIAIALGAIASSIHGLGQFDHTSGTPPRLQPLHCQLVASMWQKPKKGFIERSSMNLLSHHWTRRLVAGLFLVAAGLVPLKTVFACAIMEQISERCCCENKRQASAASEDAVSSDRCCAVVVESSIDVGLSATAESVAKKPVQKLWDSSPDLATAPPVLLATIEFSSTSQDLFLPEPHLLDGSTLYLLTARLRL